MQGRVVTQAEPLERNATCHVISHTGQSGVAPGLGVEFRASKGALKAAWFSEIVLQAGRHRRCVEVLGGTKMRRAVICGALYFWILCAVAASAQGYSYQVISVPGSQGTNTASMNNAAAVVGNYLPFGGETSHGYLYSVGHYSDVYFSGSHFTSPIGINNTGQIVGLYEVGGVYHGFMLSGGNYTTLDYPRGSMTWLNAINDAGEIVGVSDVAFLYSDGIFTTLSVPNGRFTTPLAINNSGQIVGYYDDAQGRSHGFLYSNGRYTTIDFPVVGQQTELTGINNQGVIFGYYTDPGFLNHPFVYQNGRFTRLPLRSLQNAYFTGFNDDRQFVGYYLQPSQIGFLGTPE